MRASRIAGAISRALEIARTELLGINGRNVRLVYPNNPRRYFPYADDKVFAKELLSAAGVPVPVTFFVAESFADLPALMRDLAERSSFVIKPANGSAGGGVLVVTARCGGSSPAEAPAWQTAGGRVLSLADLRRHAADILFGSFTLDVPDKALVEDRLVPHPALAALFPDGLSDVRVITLRGVPAAAMVRVPTRASGGRANLHQGAIGLGVDLSCGRILRAVLRGRPIALHPDTGAPLVGVTIPFWDEVLAISVRAAQAMPLKYLGVDVGIDAVRGPVVLEVNKRPGLEIQNVNGHGLRRLLEAIP